MKRISIIVTLLVSFFTVFGQTPPLQTLGNSGNEVMIRGIGSSYKGFALRNSYADTTAMNADAYLKYIPGIQARQADTIWQRSQDLTRWFRFGYVYTVNTSAISFLGNGSDGYPLEATLVPSPQAGNSVQILGDGVFVQSSVKDGLTAGGLILWVSGYTYDVSPAEYTIQGVPYTADYTQLTLANSDATYDRFDAFVANTDGTITAITGVPSDDPLRPSTDATTQVPLGFVLVTANSTSPNPNQDWIYENYITNAWTTAPSTGTINDQSTNNPFSVPTDVEFTAALNGHNIRFTSVSPPNIANFTVLSFKIRSKAVWSTNSRIVMQFYSGAIPVGTSVSLNPGVFGFNSAQISTYQIITIPLSSFGALTSVTAFLMTVQTAAAARQVNCYIDDIQLQNGIAPATGDFWALGGNTVFGNGVFGTKDNFPIRYITNNTEVARLTTTGNLLIGQTADFGGVYRVQATGGMRINATGAPEVTFVGLATDNTATQVASKDASGNLVWRDATSIGGVYTASNGLTMVGNDVQLGGTFTKNDTLATVGFNLTITGNVSGSSTGVLRVENTTAASGRAIFATVNSAISAAIQGQQLGGGTGITGTGTSGNGTTGTATTGVGIRGTATSGWGGFFETTTGIPLEVQNSHTTTTGNEVLIIARRATDGTATDNISGSFNFELEGIGATNISNQLISKWTTAANATRVSQFTITGVNNAITADLLTISGSGSTRINKYGIGTFTGTPTYGLAVDASGNIIESPVGGGISGITADNGLTANTSTNVRLGGTLLQNTSILTTASYNLTISGSNANTLIATNTASFGKAISATATASLGIAVGGQVTNGYAISGTATSGYALYGETTSGISIYGYTEDGIPLYAVSVPSTTNTVSVLANLQRLTSGTAADGIGGSVDFYVNTTITGQISNQLISKWTTAAELTRTSQFIITGVNSAVTADLFTLSGSGATRLNKYGINTFAGVAAYVLGVDASGNIVEVAAAGAGMTNVLTTTGDIIYSSSGSTPARLGIGTSGQVLTVSAGGIVEWTTVVGTGSVTNVSWTGGIVSIANPTTTPAFTIAGTSGGIPYFSSTSTWASSALLGANNIMIGGGAGVAPSTTTTGTGVLTALGINVGSAGAFVTFNGALGTPSSGVATNLTGTATALNIGGTAPAGSLTGTTLNATVVTSSLTSVGTIVTGVWNGTDIAYANIAQGSARSVLGVTGNSTADVASIQGTADQILRINTAGTALAFGSIDLSATAAVGTTILGDDNGGTGFFSYTAGDLIYASAINTLAKLNATTNGFVLTLSAGLPVWAAAGSGTVTSIGMTVPSFLSVTPASITTAGTFAVTLSGTALPAANGGTGLTAYGSANRMLGMNAAGTALEYKTIAGTSNQITVTHAANSITLAFAYNPAWQNLTDGATVTWNGNNGGNARLTLNGTGRTLTITNPVDGYTYTIRITQGSGGLKTITTWPTGTKWPNGVAPDLSDAAGAIDVIQLTYDATSALYIGNYLYNIL